jgi:hypothetical protein
MEAVFDVLTIHVEDDVSGTPVVVLRLRHVTLAVRAPEVSAAQLDGDIGSPVSHVDEVKELGETAHEELLLPLDLAGGLGLVSHDPLAATVDQRCDGQEDDPQAGERDTFSVLEMEGYVDHSAYPGGDGCVVEHGHTAYPPI